MKELTRMTMMLWLINLNETIELRYLFLSYCASASSVDSFFFYLHDERIDIGTNRRISNNYLITSSKWQWFRCQKTERNSIFVLMKKSIGHHSHDQLLNAFHNHPCIQIESIFLNKVHFFINLQITSRGTKILSNIVQLILA